MAVAESDQLRLYSDILEMSFGVSEPFELASPDDSISLEAGALRLETSLHAATSPPGAVPRLVARQPAEQPAGGPKADSGYGRVARVTVDAGSPGRAQPAQESRQRGAPRTPGMAVVCGKPRQQPESDDTQSVVDPRSHAPKAASKTEHRSSPPPPPSLLSWSKLSDILLGLIRLTQVVRCWGSSGLRRIIRSFPAAPTPAASRRQRRTLRAGGALSSAWRRSSGRCPRSSRSICSACGSATSVGRAARRHIRREISTGRNLRGPPASARRRRRRRCSGRHPLRRFPAAPRRRCRG